MNKLVFRYPTEEEEKNLPYDKQYCLIVKIGDTEYILEESLYFTHSGSIYHIEYDCNSDMMWESTTLIRSDKVGEDDRDLVDPFKDNTYTIEGQDLQELVDYIVANSDTLEKVIEDYNNDEDEDDDYEDYD